MLRILNDVTFFLGFMSFDKLLLTGIHYFFYLSVFNIDFFFLLIFKDHLSLDITFVSILCFALTTAFAIPVINIKNHNSTK